MKKNRGFAIRVTGFLVVFAICFGVYTRLITPKFFTDIDWPTNTTYA